MSQAWLAQRERGTLGALRLITWITRHIGYGAGRALLHPICVYFIVFSKHARRSSRAYLARMFGKPPTWAQVYRHYHTFASAILDRVMFVSEGLDKFDVRVHDGERVAQALAKGRGCLLLGAHLGSFEVVRAAATTQPGLIINVVMHEGNAGKILAWTREMAPELVTRMIAPGHPDTMLRIRDVLMRGEVVAMLGDRPIGRSGTQGIDILGGTAQFPTGPLRLAIALDTPVVMFFGLYRGPRCYDLFFETLDVAAGTSRSRSVALALADYVERLEFHARSAPYNWFNFYDYWGDA